MQIYHFLCKGCGYESKLPLGSSELDQVLTDANADYAEYNLYRCNKELEFVHADIHNNDFEGRCAVDGSKLEKIDWETPPIKCPHCDRNLAIRVNAPLADYDTMLAQ